MGAFFIAIPVTGLAVTRAEAGQVGLQTGTLVPPEDFHVTLAYIGPCHDRTVEDIAHGLGKISAPAMELQLDGLGTFGEPPRLLFAGIKADPELTRLRKRVRRVIAESGIELPHQRFYPHVTLARFPRVIEPEDLAHLQSHIARRMGMVRGAVPAEEFVLFESLPVADGRVYEPLVRFPLQG